MILKPQGMMRIAQHYLEKYGIRIFISSKVKVAAPSGEEKLVGRFTLFTGTKYALFLNKQD